MGLEIVAGLAAVIAIVCGTGAAAWGICSLAALVVGAAGSTRLRSRRDTQLTSLRRSAITVAACAALFGVAAVAISA